MTSIEIAIGEPLNCSKVFNAVQNDPKLDDLQKKVQFFFHTKLLYKKI